VNLEKVQTNTCWWIWCRDSSACNVGEECLDGKCQCVEECCDDSQCASDHTCNGNHCECAEECCEDSDCSEGECQANQCVTD
jgi:hypothetical protein